MWPIGWDIVSLWLADFFALHPSVTGGHFVAKLFAIAKLTWPTQPSILLGSVNVLISACITGWRLLNGRWELRMAVWLQFKVCDWGLGLQPRFMLALSVSHSATAAAACGLCTFPVKNGMHILWSVTVINNEAPFRYFMWQKLGLHTDFYSRAHDPLTALRSFVIVMPLFQCVHFTRMSCRRNSVNYSR